MIHTVQLKSESASLTKSLRGAQAFVARTSIKHEDDEHECNIKKGEKFYLKKLGKRHYLIDVEGKEMYQFSINAKQYAALSKKHKPHDDSAPTGRPGRVATGIGRGKDTARKRPKTGPKAKPASRKSSTTGTKGKAPTDADLRKIQEIIGSKAPLSDPEERKTLINVHLRDIVDDIAGEEAAIKTDTYGRKTAKARLAKLKRAKNLSPSNLKEQKQLERKIAGYDKAIATYKGRIAKHKADMKASQAMLSKIK